jgi:adenine-specific DNA-methyltransferase
MMKNNYFKINKRNRIIIDKYNIFKFMTNKDISNKKFLNHFVSYSKISAIENNLDNSLVQKSLYYYILKDLAKRENFILPFKIKEYEKIIQFFKDFKLEHSLFLKNSDFFDDLYEQINVKTRTKQGQIFTPNPVADFMISLLPTTKQNILDPAIGTGRFPNNILQNIPKSSNNKIFGFDIDPLILNITFSKLKLISPNFKNLTLQHDDFLQFEGKEKFDSIICNPPYLNFHDFDNQNLPDLIEKKFGIKISRLTNIYSLFFITALEYLKQDGKMIFITPSEFFYTGYGETLKKFFLDNFTIKGFVIFDFSEILFKGHLTTSVITFLEKKKPHKSHKVNFVKIKKWPKNNSELKKILISGKTQNSDYVVYTVLQSKLDPYAKWQIYFENQIQNIYFEKLIPLSVIAHVTRGIATGNNEFFTLSIQEINHWKIEKKFLKPVLTRAQNSKNYIFTEKNWNDLVIENKKVSLLYCFEEPSPNLQKYIETGEENDIHKGYLCSHRKPWFSMEKRNVAPILASVFSRSNTKFILNQTHALNLAAFHGIYPNFDDELMNKALLCYLNSGICEEIQVTARREYGGGLHKFEPKDLEKLLVLDVTKLNKSDLKLLANLFDSLCISKDPEQLKSEIDIVIRKIMSKL